MREERAKDQENRSKAQKYSVQEMNFDQTVQYDNKKTLCPIPNHMMTNYMSEQKEDKPPTENGEARAQGATHREFGEWNEAGEI